MNHSFAAVMKTRPRPAETDLLPEGDSDFAFDTTLER
jgi:hypothetical protein